MANKKLKLVTVNLLKKQNMKNKQHFCCSALLQPVVREVQSPGGDTDVFSYFKNAHTLFYKLNVL